MAAMPHGTDLSAVCTRRTATATAVRPKQQQARAHLRAADADANAATNPHGPPFTTAHSLTHITSFCSPNPVTDQAKGGPRYTGGERSISFSARHH